jgi:hypothetical protein
MTQKIPTIRIITLLATLLLSTAIQPQPVQAEKPQDLHALIAPSVEENAWLAIPWQTDLVAAQKLATEQGKPIFLWEMDGHPLGCV